MTERTNLYLIGSLRNSDVPVLGNDLRRLGFDVFDDWYAAGKKADDAWQTYEQGRGHTFAEALQGYAAQNVFAFDSRHLVEADIGVLLMPAGKSGHIEAGILVGQGKPVYVLLPEEPERKLTPDWHWLTGVYEGEGCVTYNGKRKKTSKTSGIKIQLNSTDEDVIRRLREISGVGYVYGPYKNKASNLKKTPIHGTKPQWRWAVHRIEDVLYVLRGMYPYLSQRRQKQIQQVLANIDLEMAEEGPSPAEARWDVMYAYFAGVFCAKKDLMKVLKRQLPHGN